MLRTKKQKFTISAEEFKSRRDKLLAFIANLNIDVKDLDETAGADFSNYPKRLVLKSGEEKNFSNDVFYPFRVNSDFYYLTGFTESEAVLVFEPAAVNPVSLYIKQADETMIIWEGERETISSAKEKYGIDNVLDIKEYDKSLEDDIPNLFTEKVLKFIHSLRAIKSNAELDIMRRSNEIAIQAHSMIPNIIEQGIYEYELEAHLNRAFRAQGASGWAYPAIVAAGKNSCVLHYIKNDNLVNADDLVLVDAGAEFNYYASDITRVYSPSHRFTAEQQGVYDLVLDCQNKVINSIKAGMAFKELQDIAEASLAEGLYELKYIKDKDSKDELKKYFMHGIGHSLGIDVHDPGLDRKTDILMENMVITIEPGIYISEKGIGVRIEDNVVVKNNGFENLTEGLSK